MTKTEILEAINATIIPNDKQGITADSLNNILTEIVNAMSEGSGGSGYYIDMTLANLDDPESVELTSAAMEHNASVYNALVAGLQNSDYSSAAPITVMVEGIAFSQAISIAPALDEFDSLRAYFLLPLLADPSNDMFEGTAGSVWVATGLNVVYIDIRPDGSISTGTPGVE